MSTPNIRWTETEREINLVSSCDLKSLVLRAINTENKVVFQCPMLERRDDDPMSLRRGKIRIYIRITEEG